MMLWEVIVLVVVVLLLLLLLLLLTRVHLFSCPLLLAVWTHR
jgi:hypothetical protein